MAQHKPEGLQRRGCSEERVFFVRVHLLRNKPATDFRTMHIFFVHVNPPGPNGSSPRPPPALRHRNLFPHSPIFHERALLLSCTLDQTCWEGLTRKLVMDGLSKTPVLLQLLLLVLDVILEDCAIDLHGLVARVRREVVQTSFPSEVTSRRAEEGLVLRGGAGRQFHTRRPCSALRGALPPL